MDAPAECIIVGRSTEQKAQVKGVCKRIEAAGDILAKGRIERAVRDACVVLVASTSSQFISEEKEREDAHLKRDTVWI